MTLAAERRQQQTGCLPLWQGSFARPQHLRVEIDRAENRTAGHRIDIIDHDSLMGIAVPILVGVERRFHLLPAIDIHGRRQSAAALVIDEARHQAALAVNPLRVIAWKARGLYFL